MSTRVACGRRPVASRCAPGSADRRLDGRSERDPDDGSLAGLRVQVDSATQRTHELPHDREPEPEATRLIACLKEPVEEPFVDVVGDSAAVVSDLDADGACRHRRGTKLDGASVTVSERVLDDAEDDLLEKLGAGKNDQLVLAADDDRRLRRSGICVRR